MEALTYIDSLQVGEIGDKVVEVRDSISNLSFSSSANSITEIKFVVHDPAFRMFNSNYFMIGRRVIFNSIEFEIAAVGLSHSTTDTTEVTARSRPMQRMRRQKGPKSYGVIAPTQAAAAIASEFGMNFFGEPTPVDGEIVRLHDENKDESTLDMLSRFANELDFMFFEAKNTLFFASESFIVKNQPEITINVPSIDTDPVYSVQTQLRQSIDNKKPATFQASLVKTATTTNIFPGTAVKINGVSHFTGKFMVDQVSFDMQMGTLVDISGTDVSEHEEMVCSLNTYRRGATGDCVKRIQQAVGAKIDGQFGPATERSVRQFQARNNIPQTGVVDSVTWNAIERKF